MKAIQTLQSADSAPTPGLNHGLSVVSQCSICMAVSGKDSLGTYQGVLFCDSCADDLKPDLYNAELEEIMSSAEYECAQELGTSISGVVRIGMIALVEDDMGDLAYASPNYGLLLGEAAVLGESTSEFLPAEIKLTHRKMQRESITTRVKRDCLQTVLGRHWICKIMPFVAAAEVFTLTLFQLTV